jgi:hypothetical protein
MLMPAAQIVVADAAAGPRHPTWGDGFQAALGLVMRFLVIYCDRS